MQRLLCFFISLLIPAMSFAHPGHGGNDGVFHMIEHAASYIAVLAVLLFIVVSILSKK